MRHPRHFLKTYLLICLIGALLVGCGFHLRGIVQMPSTITPMLIQSKQPNAAFTQALIRALKANHVMLTKDKSSARAIVVLEGQTLSDKLTAITGGSLAGQHQLTITIHFRVVDQQGNVLLPSTKIQQQREYNSNNTQILASSNTVAELKADMRNQLVYELINELAAIKPASANETQAQ